MIAGNNSRRDYTLGDVTQPDPPKSFWAELNQTSQSDLAQRAIGFNCLNYNKAPEGSLYRHSLPDKTYLDENCLDGVRFELMFPCCWNGKDIDSPNHQEHVAYPNLVMTGDCPPDYPVRLVSLFFETIWGTFAYQNRSGQFVLSNGDTRGLSYHGDYMMGWDENFLQDAVNTCTNPSGKIEDCPLFNIDLASSLQCSMPLPQNIAAENVTGPRLKELPGNLPVLSGTLTVNPSAASPLVPTLSYSPGSTASVNGTYQPGEVFYASHATSSTLTPAPSTPTYEAVSTQCVTSNGVVSEVVWEEAVVIVTDEVVVTVTVDPPTAPAKVKAKRGGHAHRHVGRHGGPS